MTTNEKLLTYPNEILTELEKQRRYILRIAMTPIGCGRCGGMHSQVEASGRTLETFDSKEIKDEDYICPDTGDSIRWVVPFIGNPHFIFNRKTLGTQP